MRCPIGTASRYRGDLFCNFLWILGTLMEAGGLIPHGRPPLTLGCQSGGSRKAIGLASTRSRSRLNSSLKAAFEVSNRSAFPRVRGSLTNPSSPLIAEDQHSLTESELLLVLQLAAELLA